MNGNHHINALVKKANTAYKSILRFNSAPEKVKLTLYKSIIRPTFEYAPLPSFRSRKCNLEKLQKLQNKSLRFVNGSRLLDFVPNTVLHQKFSIDNVKERLYNLAKRQINTILDGELEHTHILQNFIAPQIQGQSLWTDFTD